METGVLERIRGFEADIEKCIESIVQQELFSADITNERHRILLDHFKLAQLQTIKNLSEKLLDVYLDEDEIVEAQQAPTDGAEVVAAAVKKFEGRVADIREYHLTYRDLPTIKNQLAMPDPSILETLFSVSERYGSCLDLEHHYNRYSGFMVNTATTANDSRDGATSTTISDMVERMAAWAGTWPSRLEYFRFVPELPEMMTSAIDATRKLTGFATYKAFVEGLLHYLIDFQQRVHPLNTDDVPRLLAETEDACEEFWAALSKESADVAVISEAYGKERGAGGDSASDNEEEGEANRAAPRRRGPRLPHGVKASCGLTVPPPLKRYIKSFSMWPLALVHELVTFRNETTERLHGSATWSAEEAKSHATLAQAVEQLPVSVVGVKDVCMTEAKVSALLRSLLFDVLQQTERAILRDYSKTTEELELDRARADSEFAESLEAVRRNSATSLEGVAMSYAVAHQSIAAQMGVASGGGAGSFGTRGVQPVVVAAASDKGSGGAMQSGDGDLADSLVNEKFIGEDGTAIPRWLIQLQQLEKSFVCEVCGGTVYQGPKVFREHFGQERHTEGLRRLGISQNLREFEGIASIRSAIEMRDRLGNVYGTFRKRLREDKELEEIQDGQGHVLTNRQYLSLQQRSRPV